MKISVPAPGTYRPTVSNINVAMLDFRRPRLRMSAQTVFCHYPHKVMNGLLKDRFMKVRLRKVTVTLPIIP